MTNESMAEQRQRLITWIKAQLLGSHLGDGDMLGVSPLQRYVSGILFPIDEYGTGIDPASDDPEPMDVAMLDASIDAKEDEPTSKQRRYAPPSSVGFSFFITGVWQIQLSATAKRFVSNASNHQTRDEHTGRYDKIVYQVCQLRLPQESIVVDKAGEFAIFEHKDGKHLAKIDVRVQPYGGGNIITATLINDQYLDYGKSQSLRQDQAEHSLFDVHFDCVIDKGRVGDYPSVDYALLSEDEQEIQLQYADKKVYAVGHGVAVAWQSQPCGRVDRIYTDFIPTHEVPQVTADISQTQTAVLSMSFLAMADTQTATVCQALTELANAYQGWISEQTQLSHTLDGGYQGAGERLLGRMQTAHQRMCTGIRLIAHDKKVARAFAIANRAMLMQMQQSKNTAQDCHWRAFQLAFILMALVSTTDQDDPFRKTVDLIWFPTGGGKTEAYLGLSAYLMIYRRLAYPDNYGGTAVLMRYTLRLLTTQQFVRACRMIFALELIRQSDDTLGTEPISIGLWVGSDTSPNTLKSARQAYQRVSQNHDISHFVLDRCPWCQGAFTHHNLHFQTGRFDFYCHNPCCDFGKASRPLPCQIVDEMLYKEPPTLLVATIDKLARLAWQEETGIFLGVGGERAPELIVQDELHLIANEIGSISGIYESAIQTVLRHKNIYPKYIASTATIKEAKNQVQKLFGRDLAVFPPQGLSAKDAFFAKEVPLSERAGRLYVGYFAPLLNRQTNFAPLAGLLLLAPFAVFGRSKDEYQQWLDAWWTQIVYHGSLKGVGNTHNAFDIDVPTYYQQYLTEFMDKHRDDCSDDPAWYQTLCEQMECRAVPKFVIEQLTSNATASQNAQTFARLALPNDNQQCIDAVLATIMVAVGLDVARLALMVINGQPLTTSEYIQASSRVGRGQIGGVVFVNYYKDQARSLSHYENFYPYHQSFYRFVEPTSITPYTYQARRRALHAGLVISLRHSVADLADNAGAGRLDTGDKQTLLVIERFIKQCCLADPQRRPEITRHVHQLVQAWRDYIHQQANNRQKLYYQAPDAASASLLYVHGSSQHGLWATLNSMRNVEHTGVLRIEP